MAHHSNYSAYKHDDVADVVEEALYLSALLNQLDDAGRSHTSPPRSSGPLPPAQPPTQPLTTHAPSSAYADLFGGNEMPVSLYSRGSPQAPARGGQFSQSSGSRQSAAYSPVTRSNTSVREEHTLHMDAADSSFFTAYADPQPVDSTHKPSRWRSPSEGSSHSPEMQAHSDMSTTASPHAVSAFGPRSPSPTSRYLEPFDSPAPPVELHSSAGSTGGEAQLPPIRAIRTFMLIQSWLSRNGSEERHRRRVQASYLLTSRNSSSSIGALSGSRSIALMIHANLTPGADPPAPAADISYSGGYEGWLRAKVLSLVSLQAVADIFQAWRHYTHSMARAHGFYIRRLKQSGVDMIVENLVMESGKKKKSEVAKRVRANRNKRIAKGAATEAPPGGATPKRVSSSSKSWNSRKDMRMLQSKGGAGASDADTDTDYELPVGDFWREEGDGVEGSFFSIPEPRKTATLDSRGRDSSRPATTPSSAEERTKQLQLQAERISSVERTRQLQLQVERMHLREVPGTGTGELRTEVAAEVDRALRQVGVRGAEEEGSRLRAELGAGVLLLRSQLEEERTDSRRALEREMEGARRATSAQLAELDTALRRDLGWEVEARKEQQRALQEELAGTEKHRLMEIASRIDAMRANTQVEAERLELRLREEFEKQLEAGLSVVSDEALRAHEAVLQRELLQLRADHDIRIKDEELSMRRALRRELDLKAAADAMSIQEFARALERGGGAIEKIPQTQEDAFTSSLLREHRSLHDAEAAIAHDEALKAHEATLQQQAQQELARMQLEHEAHLMEKEMELQLELQRMRQQQGLHEEELKAHEASVQLELQHESAKMQLEHDMSVREKELALQSHLMDKEVQLQLALHQIRESTQVATAHEEALKAHEETLQLQLRLQLENAKALTHEEALKSHEEIRLVEVQLELQRMREHQGLHEEELKTHEETLRQELRAELTRLEHSGDLIAKHEESLRLHEETRMAEIFHELQHMREAAAAQAESERLSREASVRLEVRKESMRLQAAHDVDLKRLALGMQRKVRELHLHRVKHTPLRRAAAASVKKGPLRFFEPVDDCDEPAPPAQAPSAQAPCAPTPSPHSTIDGVEVFNIVAQKTRRRSTIVEMEADMMTRRRDERQPLSRSRVLFKDKHRLRPGVRAVRTAVVANLPPSVVGQAGSSSAADEYLQDKIHLHFCFWRLYRRSVYTSMALKVLRRGSVIRATKAMRCWRRALRALPDMDAMVERVEDALAAVKLRHAIGMFAVNINLVRAFRTYCNKVKFKLEQNIVALRAVHTMFCAAYVHTFVTWKAYAERYGITSAEKAGMRSHCLRYKKRQALEKWFEVVNLWKLMRSVGFTLKGAKSPEGGFVIGSTADAANASVVAHPSLSRALWKWMSFANSSRMYFSFADFQGSKVRGQETGRKHIRAAVMRSRFLSSCRVFPKGRVAAAASMRASSRGADFNYEASTPSHDGAVDALAMAAPTAPGRTSARLAGFRASHLRTIVPSCALRYGDAVVDRVAAHGLAEKKRMIDVRTNNVVYYDLNHQRLRLRFVLGYADPYLNHYNKCETLPEVLMRRRFVDRATNLRNLRAAERHRQFVYEPRPPSVVRCEDGTYMASAPLCRIYFGRLFCRFFHAKSKEIVVGNLVHEKSARGARLAVRRLAAHASRPERLAPRYTHTFLTRVASAIRWLRKVATIRAGRRQVRFALRMRYFRQWKSSVVALHVNKTSLGSVLRRWNMLYKYNLNTRLFLKKYASRISEAFIKWQDVMKMETRFELAIIAGGTKRCKKNAMNHAKKMCLCLRMERRLMKKRFFWKFRRLFRSAVLLADVGAAAEVHFWRARALHGLAVMARNRRLRHITRRERQDSRRVVKGSYFQAWYGFCFAKPSKRVVRVQDHFSTVFAKKGFSVRRLTKLFQSRPARFMQETAEQLRSCRLQRKYLQALLVNASRRRAERRRLQAVEDAQLMLCGLRSLFRNTLQLANSREYTKIGAMYCCERSVRRLLRLWRLRAKVLHTLRARRARAQRFLHVRMKADGVFVLKRDVLFDRNIRRERKSNKSQKQLVSN